MIVVTGNQLVVDSVSYSLYAVMNRFDSICVTSGDVVFDSCRDDFRDIVSGLQSVGLDIARIGIRRWYGIHWEGQPMLSLGVACGVVSVWVAICFGYSQLASCVHAQIAADTQQFSQHIIASQKLWQSVKSSRESLRFEHDEILSLCSQLLQDESFDLLSCRIEAQAIDIVGMYQGAQLARFLGRYRDRLSLESSVALVDSRHVVRLIGDL